MTRVCLWNKAGDDVGDMVSRSRRVVDTMQELLGGQEGAIQRIPERCESL